MSIAAFNSLLLPASQPQNTVNSPNKEGTIFIVDHEVASVEALEKMLHCGGYNDVHSTLDASAAPDLARQICPDLVLLNIATLSEENFAFIELLQAGTAPIVILTDEMTPHTRCCALQKGAQDFLSKPLDPTAVLQSVDNLLKARAHDLQLEQKIGGHTQKLEQAQVETMQRLALATGYRCDKTGKQSQRVARIAVLLARQMGLDEAQVELIERAAPLHDVGKIGVADSILLKPGKLTQEEFDAMKRHTTIGAQILGGSSSPDLQMAEQIALFHHERWDGLGYAGIAGEQIPLSGRIVSVAVVFDALTHERPYKAAWTTEAAVEEIVAQSGRQFDPRVVEAFVKLNHADLVG